MEGKNMLCVNQLKSNKLSCIFFCFSFSTFSSFGVRFYHKGTVVLVKFLWNFAGKKSPLSCVEIHEALSSKLLSNQAIFCWSGQQINVTNFNPMWNLCAKIFHPNEKFAK